MSEQLYSFTCVPGIDTLYYFNVTNHRYEDLFLDIIDQLQRQIEHFKSSKISYQDHDIKLKIGASTLEYRGKAQGFHWLMDLNGLFRFGLKDPNTNKNLHNIQVQLTAEGIYSVGIKGLVRYLDNLLEKYITGEKPITRADLNIFVQHDLSSLHKDDFVTRKRSFDTFYREIANKHALETLYVGKKPFMLRLYDKAHELKKSKKQNLMKEYLASHEVDIKQDLFNIEFEMHRDYLKEYEIESVDQLLERAQLLFKNSMDAIRMIDLEGFTDNTEKQSNRYRAPTHPLWEYISSQYQIDEFIQLDTPLERVKKLSYVYSFEDSVQDHLILARKCITHQIPISKEYYKLVLDTMAYPTTRPNELSIMKHTLVDEVDYPDVNALSIFELKSHIKSLEHDMNDPNKDLEATMRQYGKAIARLDALGFPMSFPF